MKIPIDTEFTIIGHRATYNASKESPYIIVMGDTEGNIFDLILATDVAVSLMARLSMCMEAAATTGRDFDAGLVRHGSAVSRG
jgi:hypothetical protein